MLIRESRTYCSMPHSAMKPWPPYTCMQCEVAIHALSVMKALMMGVSSATSSAAAWRSASSSLASSTSSCSEVYMAIARPPSA